MKATKSRTKTAAKPKKAKAKVGGTVVIRAVKVKPKKIKLVSAITAPFKSVPRKKAKAAVRLKRVKSKARAKQLDRSYIEQLEWRCGVLATQKNLLEERVSILVEELEALDPKPLLTQEVTPSGMQTDGKLPPGNYRLMDSREYEMPGDKTSFDDGKTWVDIEFPVVSHDLYRGFSRLLRRPLLVGDSLCCTTSPSIDFNQQPERPAGHFLLYSKDKIRDTDLVSWDWGQTYESAKSFDLIDRECGNLIIARKATDVIDRAVDNLAAIPAGWRRSDSREYKLSGDKISMDNGKTFNVTGHPPGAAPFKVLNDFCITQRAPVDFTKEPQTPYGFKLLEVDDVFLSSDIVSFDYGVTWTNAGRCSLAAWPVCDRLGARQTPQGSTPEKLSKPAQGVDDGGGSQLPPGWRYRDALEATKASDRILEVGSDAVFTNSRGVKPGFPIPIEYADILVWTLQTEIAGRENVRVVTQDPIKDRKLFLGMKSGSSLQPCGTCSTPTTGNRVVGPSSVTPTGGGGGSKSQSEAKPPRGFYIPHDGHKIEADMWWAPHYTSDTMYLASPKEVGLTVGECSGGRVWFAPNPGN